ncbi:hypothetical protein RQN30_05445 [Arcanobacterium hippocoleae]
MLQALRHYPDQIESLLKAVAESLNTAQEQLAAGERNSAVPYAKMGEETLSQAAALFARIDSASTELETAKERFSGNIAS